MPYKRKKKNGHSRPGYVRCGKMVISDASKALSLAKYLKTIVNVEKKNHDTAVNQTAVTTTPNILQATNMAQGDTNITRDGSQCKFISLHYKYFWEINASAVLTQVRTMIVLDKQTNQLIYAAGDLLSDITVRDAIVSPRNLDNMRRFQVLFDRVHTLSVTAGKQQVYGSFYKKLQLMVRFDNAAAAISSLTQNSLSVLVVSSEATNTPLLTHSLRLMFVDN